MSNEQRETKNVSMDSNRSGLTKLERLFEKFSKTYYPQTVDQQCVMILTCLEHDLKLGSSTISKSNRLKIYELVAEKRFNALLKSSLLVHLLGLMGNHNAIPEKKVARRLANDQWQELCVALESDDGVSYLSRKDKKPPGTFLSKHTKVIFVANVNYAYSALGASVEPVNKYTGHKVTMHKVCGLSTDQRKIILSFQRLSVVDEQTLYNKSFLHYMFRMPVPITPNTEMCKRLEVMLSKVLSAESNADEQENENTQRLYFPYKMPEKIQINGLIEVILRLPFSKLQLYPPEITKLRMQHLMGNVEAYFIGILVPLFLYEGNRKDYEQGHNSYYRYLNTAAWMLPREKRLLIGIELMMRLKTLMLNPEVLEAWKHFVVKNYEETDIRSFKCMSFNVLLAFAAYLGDFRVLQEMERFITSLREGVLIALGNVTDALEAGNVDASDLSANKPMQSARVNETAAFPEYVTVPKWGEDVVSVPVYYYSLIDGQNQSSFVNWRYGSILTNKLKFFNHPLVTAVFFAKDDFKTADYILNKSKLKETLDSKTSKPLKRALRFIANKSQSKELKNTVNDFIKTRL